MYKTAINKLRGKKVFLGAAMRYREKGLIETNGVKYVIKLGPIFRTELQKQSEKEITYIDEKIELDKEKIAWYESEQTRRRRIFHFK